MSRPAGTANSRICGQSALAISSGRFNGGQPIVTSMWIAPRSPDLADQNIFHGDRIAVGPERTLRSGVRRRGTSHGHFVRAARRQRSEFDAPSPWASAVPADCCLAKVMVTFSPGAAQPQMRTGIPRCTTMPSEIRLAAHLRAGDGPTSNVAMQKMNRGEFSWRARQTKYHGPTAFSNRGRIRSEWRCRQAGGVVKITVGVGRPGIPDSDGVRNFVAGDHHSLAIHDGGGRHKLQILTGDHKPFKSPPPLATSPRRRACNAHDFVPFDREVIEDRSGIGDRFAIRDPQRRERQPLSPRLAY